MIQGGGLLPDMSEISQEYNIYVSRMRDLLERLQGQRMEVQKKAEHLLQKSRTEIRKIGLGRKAMRSYGPSHYKSAKLFDGIR